jgi:hypothetical protein
MKRGRLTFHSETGTEGGYWAFQDEQFITLEPPKWGVFAERAVFDPENPVRTGVMANDVHVLHDGVWLPLPDPIQTDPDYYISSLFNGEHKGDREADARLMERYGFTMKYAADRMNEAVGEGNWTLEEPTTAVANDGKRYHYGGTPHAERPYGVRPGEITRGTVIWEDGEEDVRTSAELLVEQWSYEGLHYLKDGDYLRIFDREDPSQVVWEGTIRLRQHEPFAESAFGYWIHADHEGVPREEWAKFFLGDTYSGELESA